MATAVPFRTTPQLGPQLNEVFTGVPYYDQGLGVGTPSLGQGPSPKLGNKEVGDDGHDYIWTQASAAISAAAAPGTQVIIDEPAMTAATGAGGWYAPIAGVLINQYFWARKGAIDAP